MPALVLVFLTGCHNRAYNELYIESMAAEIRDLEDQLYEYDHEYQQLEQKLAATAAENARLQSMLSDPTAAPSQKKRPMGLDFLPRTAPKPLSEELPPPLESANESSMKERASSILEVPSLDDNSSGAAGLGGQPPANVPEQLPDPPRRNEAESMLRPQPSNGFGRPPAVEEIAPEFNLDDLTPPEIKPGEPIPPPSSGGNPGFTDRLQQGGLAPRVDELDLDSGRIELPVQLAGQLSPSTPARLTVATEQITDRRIVELAFNPVHSRSMNMDDDPADDGLVLLLQPKNERGQVVLSPAALSIVVVDPAREGNTSRIGRWDYTAAEVKGKIEPLGTAQGIHLTLPWNGPDPTADRVIVFARYTFENGRQVVGQKEIFVAGADGYKAVWTPRGTTPDAAVRHASAEQ